MRRQPVLPRLEVPTGAILYYENFAIRDAERSGNWRFYFRDDGAFFSVGNRDLWISDKSKLSSDDPAYHWARPFPERPQAQLDADQLAQLRAAIAAARLEALDAYYPTPEDEEISHQSAERWTVVSHGTAHSVVVENGFEPDALTRLRSELEKLVSAAMDA